MERLPRRVVSTPTHSAAEFFEGSTSQYYDFISKLLELMCLMSGGKCTIRELKAFVTDGHTTVHKTASQLEAWVAEFCTVVPRDERDAFDKRVINTRGTTEGITPPEGVFRITSTRTQVFNGGVGYVAPVLCFDRRSAGGVIQNVVDVMYREFLGSCSDVGPSDIVSPRLDLTFGVAICPSSIMYRMESGRLFGVQTIGVTRTSVRTDEVLQPTIRLIPLTGLTLPVCKSGQVIIGRGYVFQRDAEWIVHEGVIIRKGFGCARAFSTGQLIQRVITRCMAEGTIIHVGDGSLELFRAKNVQIEGIGEVDIRQYVAVRAVSSLLRPLYRNWKFGGERRLADRLHGPTCFITSGYMGLLTRHASRTPHVGLAMQAIFARCPSPRDVQLFVYEVLAADVSGEVSKRLEEVLPLLRDAPPMGSGIVINAVTTYGGVEQPTWHKTQSCPVELNLPVSRSTALGWSIEQNGRVIHEYEGVDLSMPAYGELTVNPRRVRPEVNKAVDVIDVSEDEARVMVCKADTDVSFCQTLALCSKALSVEDCVLAVEGRSDLSRAVRCDILSALGASHRCDVCDDRREGRENGVFVLQEGLYNMIKRNKV